MKRSVEVPQQRIAEFCKRHHIHKLALFGSFLRPDFRPESDIDVLVEFDPAHVPGLSFFAMQDELGAILGRPGGFEHAARFGPIVPRSG